MSDNNYEDTPMLNPHPPTTEYQPQTVPDTAYSILDHLDNVADMLGLEKRNHTTFEWRNYAMTYHWQDLSQRFDYTQPVHQWPAYDAFWQLTTQQLQRQIQYYLTQYPDRLLTFEDDHLGQQALTHFLRRVLATTLQHRLQEYTPTSPALATLQEQAMRFFQSVAAQHHTEFAALALPDHEIQEIKENAIWEMTWEKG